MKFNKRTIITTVAIALSGATIAASALAMSSNLQGYNAFKEKFVSMASGKTDYTKGLNYTTATHVVLKKADTTLVTLNNTILLNQTWNKAYISSESYNKSEITLADGTVTSNETWSASNPLKDAVFIKKTNNDDKYYRSIMPVSEEQKKVIQEDMNSYSSANDMLDNNTDSQAMKNFMGGVIDLVAGDTKNHFVLNGDAITLELEGAQIPEIAQLGLQVIIANLKDEAVKSSANATYMNSPEQLIYKEIVSLSNLKFEKIYSTLSTIDSKETFVITISGYDQNGKKEVYTLEAEISETDKGTTVVTLPDLTGKTVVDESAESTTTTY